MERWNALGRKSKIVVGALVLMFACYLCSLAIAAVAGIGSVTTY